MFPSDAEKRVSNASWHWMSLLLITAPFFFLLPFFQRGILASPDETAVRWTAVHLFQEKQLWLNERLAMDFPWLHPRSFVSFGTRLVPVGFFAWPLFLSVFAWGNGMALPWIATFFVWSSIYPAYRLLRTTFSPAAAWAGTLAAYFTPALVLYANRSLFPNPALWAATMWLLWASTRLSSSRSILWGGFGAAVVAVLSIRPIEIFWLGPWIIFFLWKQRNALRVQRIAFFSGVGVMSFFLAMINRWIYGSWWQVSYWMHDNAMDRAQNLVGTSVSGSIFPFGIHPSHIVWNVRFFLAGIWAPWLLLSVVAVGIFLWRQRTERVSWVPFLLLGWTAVSLVLFYGNGLYADHVRVGAVTVGNSFLRYTLPLAAIVGVSLAWLMDRATHRWLRSALLVCAVGLSVVGVYRATWADEEGVWPTGQELQRYASIREAALAALPPQTVVFSERSDKLFFEPLRAVTPIPPRAEIRRLLDASNDSKEPSSSLWLSAAVFMRPPSQQERDAWSAAGIELQLIGTFGRENLYQLKKRP